MASVDDRIVRLEFDNASFERKIGSTLASLGQLDKALQFTNAQKGLAGLSEATSRFDLSGVASAIENISSKFSALGAIGFSVIQSLTQSVLGFVKKIGGDILDPIFGGGFARAKNIEQAKFMFEGLGISIEEGMKSALDAVKGTAFGLDEAAKAAAQFGASGIQVGDQMTGALRGVAGAAAMTGRSFSEIADIFAGSAGTGKVTNQDLMQFATRGLNAAAALGKVLGKTEAQVHEMAAAGELDFATFANAMDQAFGAHATEANKTFSGALANMHAALSRLGAAIIGPQLTHFRDIFNALTPVIDNLTAAFQPLIDTFSVITGYIGEGLIRGLSGISFDNLKAAMPSLVDGLKNIFVALKTIWDIGKAAFQNIFPPGTESIIVKIADGFKALTAALIPGAAGASKLQSIFQGVFAALSIGWTVLKEGVKFISNLAKSLAGMAGPGVLGFFTKLADGLTNLQASLVKGGGIKSFFDDLTKSLQKPLAFLERLKDAIGGLFGGFKDDVANKVSDSMGRIGDRFSGLKEVFSRIGDIWQPFEDALQKVVGVLDAIWQVISEWFKTLGQKIAAAMGPGDFNAVLDLINVGLLGGIVALLTKFFKSGFKLDLGGGFFEKVSGILDQVTGSLKTMQLQVKANVLLKIAEAIAILTASVVVLSLIDSAALAKSLAAMAVGFGELMASFAVLTKLADTPKGAAVFVTISTGLTILATAILILSGAMAILGTMSWEDISKGLLAISLLLGGLVLVTKPLAANSKGMITAGVGITAMAIALTILAGALKIFATMSWEELAKGLLAVGLLLAGIAGAMHLMPSDAKMVAMGAGLLLIAVAMNILAGAVLIFGHMKWEVMGKGLLGLAGALLIIAGAMHLMPQNMLLIAAGLLVVSVALTIIAKALKMMGSMSWEEIAKGLITLAAALIVIAVAANAMEGALPGAAAMVVMAFALTILAGVLKTIGKMSWGDIIKGLVGIALALTLIGVASILLIEAVPEIAALGVALVILGAGFALLGVGAYLVAAAFEKFVAGVKAAANALPEIVSALSKVIPAALKAVAEGVVEAIQVFTDAAPAIAKAVGTLVEYIIDTLILLVPKVVTLLGTIIDGFVVLVNEKSPDLIQAGLTLLINFLKGVDENIEQITGLVARIIQKFIDKLTEKMPEFKDSIVALITTAMQQASEGLGEVAAQALVGNGISFMEGFLHGLESSLGLPQGFFESLPGKILGWIGDAFSWLIGKGTDIIAGLASGIGSRFNSVIAWFGGLPSSIAGYFSGAVNWLLDAGNHIIDGLVEGMKAAWHKAEDFLGGIKDKVENILSGKFIFGSPSKVMEEMGNLIMLGMDIGMKNTWEDTSNWLDTVPKEVTDKMTKALSAASYQMSNMDDFNPVITPVLDLTRVAADASKIGDYIASADKLNPINSLNQAQAIAAQQKMHDYSTAVVSPPVSSVNFQQTINAPTQLSTSDIYKQTRNQITIAKEELSIP